MADKEADKEINKRPYSSLVVDGNEKAAARAMLYAVGFTEEDFGNTSNAYSPPANSPPK